MTIGGGIFLIAVGAILKFATNVQLQGVSLDTVGVILMIAGAAGLILGFVQQAMLAKRRNAEAAAAEQREVRDPNREQPPRY